MVEIKLPKLKITKIDSFEVDMLSDGWARLKLMLSLINDVPKEMEGLIFKENHEGERGGGKEIPIRSVHHTFRPFGFHLGQASHYFPNIVKVSTYKEVIHFL